MALADFPRHPLLFGPSPVHPLDRLTDHLGGARIWAKREDCNSGLAFGGNKTRKLEYLVPDALAQGARHAGLDRRRAVQPHPPGRRGRGQARAEGACWCRRAGSTGRTPVNDRVGNILLSRIMGAEVGLVEAGFGIGFKDSWEQALDDVGRGGGTPYAIPAGASDHRLGGLGFANWAYEVGAAGARAGRLLRHDRRLQRDRLARRPGMIAGFAGQDAAPRRVLGHRRLGQDRRDPRPGREDRPRTPPSSSGWAASCATTRSPCWRAGPATTTASRSQSTLDAIRLTGQPRRR